MSLSEYPFCKLAAGMLQDQKSIQQSKLRETFFASRSEIGAAHHL
jgi:hypothetical protein